MERYKLTRTKESGVWACTDLFSQAVCTFTRGEFNDSQEFSFGDGCKLTPLEAAKITADMADWLYTNHYHLTMPRVSARVFLAARIKELRIKRGLSQAALAEKCGLRQSNLARMEAARYGFSIDLLDTVLEALGANFEIVLTEDEKPDKREFD